ncbi:MAG: hypothetical protein OHK0022_23280 [Roseiflexaceae bacterium]
MSASHFFNPASTDPDRLIAHYIAPNERRIVGWLGESTAPIRSTAFSTGHEGWCGADLLVYPHTACTARRCKHYLHAFTLLLKKVVLLNNRRPDDPWDAQTAARLYHERFVRGLRFCRFAPLDEAYYRQRSDGILDGIQGVIADVNSGRIANPYRPEVWGVFEDGELLDQPAVDQLRDLARRDFQLGLKLYDEWNNVLFVVQTRTHYLLFRWQTFA